jgi:hypothetical protein
MDVLPAVRSACNAYLLLSYRRDTTTEAGIAEQFAREAGSPKAGADNGQNPTDWQTLFEQTRDGRHEYTVQLRRQEKHMVGVYLVHINNSTK